jgi:hypothetical protein
MGNHEQSGTMSEAEPVADCRTLRVLIKLKHLNIY